jgi:hypothetical protein
MWIAWKHFWYRAHDRSGNAKFLLERVADPSASIVPEVPDSIRDEALRLICESFDIPVRQMYCLRADDELMALYRGINGPRNFDQLQFERLWLELEDLLTREVTATEFEKIKTVADVINVLASRGTNRKPAHQCEHF